MQFLPSTHSRLAVMATLSALLARPVLAQATTPTFIQGVAFSTPRIPSTTVTLTRPVAQGDLLVGWFSQYNAPGEVQVSDNVNGTWTRAAAGAQSFDDDTGDIALYYRENSRAAPGGITITVSVSSTAFLQGAVADYSGVALAGALDQVAAAQGSEGRVVDTGATAAVGAGELVFAALITDAAPGSITPGSSQGIPFTPRAQTSSGSAYEEDITASAAGPQHGTATFGNAVEWYAVCAAFHPYPATPPVPPSTPTGLGTTSTPDGHHAGRVTRIRPGCGSLARRAPLVVQPDPGRAGRGRRSAGRVVQPVRRSGPGAGLGQRQWPVDALGLDDVGH